MSAALMGEVFMLDLPPVEKATLLAMADHAQDDGSGAYPSVERLVAKTGFKERAVRGAITDLRDKGILQAVAYLGGGRGHAVEYRIDVTKGARHAYFVTGKGARGAIKGARGAIKGAPDAPETSLTIIETGDTPEPQTARKAPPKKAKHAGQDYYPLASALSEVSGWNMKAYRERLFSEAKRLAPAGATPDEVRARYAPGCWWYANDWRGKRGEKPTPPQIRETWGQWEATGTPAGQQAKVDGKGVYV